MNSHHHSRDDKESIIVAFEGDSCPYCELLKKCARLEEQIRGDVSLIDEIAGDPVREYKAFGARFDSIESRLASVELHATDTAMQVSWPEDERLSEDNNVCKRIKELEEELDLCLKSNVEVTGESFRRDALIHVDAHCLRCGHEQEVLAEDVGVTLECEAPGCTNRFRVERQEEEII